MYFKIGGASARFRLANVATWLGAGNATIGCCKTKECVARLWLL